MTSLTERADGTTEKVMTSLTERADGTTEKGGDVSRGQMALLRRR
jgi:hypothetical protein